uniref:G_PROTEIN_RECEP_F1_2 domain-containing protein n=1 Tax=Strongyloides venezuelensis TaxID=75913 RepID=A0A0K0F8H1_STRVS
MFLQIINLIESLPTEQWMPPFNNSHQLALLCTDNNHKFIYTDRMHGAMTYLFQSNDTHQICMNNNETKINPKYEGLIWLITSLQSCNVIRKIKSRFSREKYNSNFHYNFLKAGFALVCQKTDDIGVYQLQFYADIFRILFERRNEDRKLICQKVVALYNEMYERCHVMNKTDFMKSVMNICNIRGGMIRVNIFFQRFARNCDTPQEFFINHNQFLYKGFGQSLTEDNIFMNSLSAHLTSTIRGKSILPHLMLKTRLLLQHFSLAAMTVYREIEKVMKCNKIDKKVNHMFEEEILQNGLLYLNQTTNDDIFIETSDDYNEDCNTTDSIYFDLIESKNYQNIGSQALIGVYVEICLLILVIFNTLCLSILLYQTQSHLSTATILFIFNILFSNFLFVSSFGILFSDLLSENPYAPLSDTTIGEEKSAAYAIAETLQSHLFAPSQFYKHLVQETLFSLSQNGSLLGLTHLLVLVLVVISKSMSGKAIRLSKFCVITVFSLVWIFLIITHIIFSLLQISAITYLDNLLDGVSSSYRRYEFECTNKDRHSSHYNDIGQRCDRVEPYHRFGVYLLRGHTLFTLIFLFVALIVFVVTLFYHWKVRHQNGVLKIHQHNDGSPHKRRETLFNTLLLSISAFFISVLGQTIIEISVFWLENPDEVADFARWYQVMRIASFVDPLLNPLLVSVRTPVIRRKLRMMLYVLGQHFITCCCPWKIRNVNRRSKKVRKSKKASITTADSASIYRPTDSEVTFRIWCTRQYVRTSFFGKFTNSQGVTNHSVV